MISGNRINLDLGYDPTPNGRRIFGKVCELGCPNKFNGPGIERGRIAPKSYESGLSDALESGRENVDSVPAR